MKEPASDSLTDQVPHEAVAVPNGGSALHGSHPLLAEAIWMKKNKITTTRACACHILCSFMPFAFKKNLAFRKDSGPVSYYKKEEVYCLLPCMHMMHCSKAQRLPGFVLRLSDPFRHACV